MSQVAKLYLRGSLCNVHLRNLNEKQQEELANVIEEVMKDPNLSRCKNEFCNALARTIGNEYKNTEYGEQDYRIAVMRAAVAAMTGQTGNEKNTKALTEPIERKKWFQTWVFNYLRQILRENKRASIKVSKNTKLSPINAALIQSKTELKNAINQIHDLQCKRTVRSTFDNHETYDVPNGFFIKINTLSFPISLNERIAVLNSTYLKHNVSIVIEDTGIYIRKMTDGASDELITIKQTTETMVKAHSMNNLSQDGEENAKECIEMEIYLRKKGPNMIDDAEMLNKLIERIPNDVVPVLNLCMEEKRPNDYISKFGSSMPKIAHMAQYLTRSPKEIKKALSIIKIHYRILELGH